MQRHGKKIVELLDQYKPKTLLEIGVLRGANTLKILEWCSKNDAHLTSLDPVQWEGEVPEEIKKPSEGYLYKRGGDYEQEYLVPTHIEEVYKKGLDKFWTCIKMRSLDFFKTEQFKGYDVYLIDGDHNFYTVTNELNAMDSKAKEGTVAFMHDVSASSWARKDQYYDESLIPGEYIRSEKQGVLTAIEHFLDEHCEKKTLFGRKNCTYDFKIITKKDDGLGLLIKR